jgi:signal transduction histidine kinase
MPAALKEFSLAVVLRNLCNEVENNSGISVGLTVGVLPEPIDQLLKTYVYRIVQEALTNVIKHSGASRANITVYADFSNLHLIIEDNGVGFNTSTPTDTGNGLYNMKERAILLNGSINIISSQGKGTKIVAQFPLKPQNQTVNG